MGSLLPRRVQNGFAIGPQVPAEFYNATEHILDNLDVWGGHIERDGLNWTIVLDEFLDTDGLPGTASGRWKTGEGAAPGTKTTYAARIWGNDTNHYPAVDLDAFTLKANDSGGNKTVDWHNTKLHANDTANTEILDWTEEGDTTSGDTARGAYAKFSRGVYLDGQPSRFFDSAQGLYTDPTGFGLTQKMQAISDFGWDWQATSLASFATNSGRYMGQHRFKSLLDTTNNYAEFDIWARHVYADTANVGMVAGAWSNTYEGATVYARICANGADTSGTEFEAFRCSDGTRRVSLLNNDTGAGDADLYVGGSGGNCTWGIRSNDKPVKIGSYVEGDSYADFAGYGEFGGYGSFAGSYVDIANAGGELRVNSTRVVTTRKASVTVPASFSETPTANGYGWADTTSFSSFIDQVDDLRDAISDIVDRLKATGGHGLIND